MSGGNPLRGLRGRRGECESLERMLAEAASGHSQVLVLRGEAGIGKSALVEYLVRGAIGYRIARAAGVESQMELAFAGLHQLAAPMLSHLDRLPEPQRDALAVAFGLRSGATPDRFLVGLAMLSLLAEVAEDMPLVCVIDDAQWLDQVSAQTLAFVARRLLAERVALVFAVRTPASGDDPLAGLPELVLRGLRDNDARALLAAAVPGRLDQRVTDRIVSEARGNPLALLELPRGLTAAELAGGFGRPDAQPVASQIERSFLRRIVALPAQPRRLLLLAAAEPVGDAALLRRAAAHLGIEPDALAAAEMSGLIELGAHVRFRHPLVRSAAYRAADPRERREAHRALAEVTDPAADPDRQVWHRANAAVEPDEEVADALERSAQRAQARGGIAAAAAFLRRATGLTPDPGRRGERAVAAAQAAFEAGIPEAAHELLATAEMGPLDEAQRARVARLRAQIVFARRRGGAALPLLLDAAARLAPCYPDQARAAYLEAIGSAVFASRLGRDGELGMVAEQARAALPDAGAPDNPADALLAGLVTRFATGYAASAAPLRRALHAFWDGRGADAEHSMRWLWLTWPTATELWDDESWHELSTRAVRAARETGALNFLPLALSYRAGVHLRAGEFDVAAVLVEESRALLEVTGNSPIMYTTLLLVAWRGEDAQAPALIDTEVALAAAWGEGRTLSGGHYLHSLLYNGLGQYRAALSSAQLAAEHDDLGMSGFALLELVEAAAYAGDLAAGEAALRQLTERADASGTGWARGISARSRALLSEGETADRLYREAIEHLGRTRIAVHLARTHLVYGEWLRREQRRAEARAQLRTAYEMLNRFGAKAFAERARRELLAIGESVRHSTIEAHAALTAQEAQIARLAGDGLTNSEIGAELFLSARTVEWHLRKVFGKLGITSRKEIRGALEN
ncbi:ATP-binding protein [Nocardia yamanashiensis]|uniref:ATP-binding protein n=1 Tax=Nocardia yamanashiensis TaxID=209247 RepID=UPI000829D710|nr:LuxR family transcriptional regulator [Nocardia yamanashiensis]